MNIFANPLDLVLNPVTTTDQLINSSVAYGPNQYAQVSLPDQTDPGPGSF